MSKITDGPGGGEVSNEVPEKWRRHPADRLHHGASANPEDFHTLRLPAQATHSISPAHNRHASPLAPRQVNLKPREQDPGLGFRGVRIKISGGSPGWDIFPSLELRSGGSADGMERLREDSRALQGLDRRAVSDRCSQPVRGNPRPDSGRVCTTTGKPAPRRVEAGIRGAFLGAGRLPRRLPCGSRVAPQLGQGQRRRGATGRAARNAYCFSDSVATSTHAFSASNSRGRCAASLV